VALRVDVVQDNHPESGNRQGHHAARCTISGLNQMEHEGFSSAMIKGIVTSAEKASRLYSPGQRKFGEPGLTIGHSQREKVGLRCGILRIKGMFFF